MKALWITLAVLGALALLVIGAGYGFYRWLDSHKGELAALAVQSKTDASKFAVGHAQIDCPVEAVRRAGSCDSIVCETGARIFLDGCLAAATPTPGLCTDVPPSTEIIDSARWAVAACDQLQANDPQRCGRVLRSYADFCDKQRSGAGH